MATTTVNHLFKKFLTNLRGRPGHITALTFFTASMGFTFYRAPLIEDTKWRYACAGTAATLFCEVVMHAVDTVNMRSKIINGPKLYVLELIKHEGVMSLFRGIQPVLYGYFVASLVYFYSYAQSKEILKQILSSSNQESSEGMSTSNMTKTAIVSFIGSGFAEFLSLAFYYPFDLIKTRMQVAQTSVTSSHRYNGTLDATLKIINEHNLFKQKSLESLIQIQPEKTLIPTETKWQLLKDRIQGIQNLYKGGFIFGTSYVVYMAFQFSLFETILLFLENHTKGQRQKADEDKKHHAKDHSYLNITIASFLAGGLAGLISNPFEFLAVNIQTQENFSIRKYLKQKGILYDLMFKGGLWRSTYHGFQAVLFFIIWQEYAMHLNVDITLYDD